MAGFQRNRRLSGSVVTDSERKIDYAIKKGINVFELQHKQRSPVDISYFGFDDILVERVETPNTLDVKMNVRIQKSTQITFVANEEDVPMAYIPDTEKNRKILALMIYEANFVIVRLITPKGDIPAEQIQKEVLQYSKQLGVRPPAPKSRTIRNAPMVKPKPTSLQEVEAEVFARHSVLIETLKKEYGEKYQKNSIYSSIILKEIDDLCVQHGITAKSFDAKEPAEIASPSPVSEPSIEEHISNPESELFAETKPSKKRSRKKEEALIE